MVSAKLALLLFTFAIGCASTTNSPSPGPSVEGTSTPVAEANSTPSEPASVVAGVEATSTPLVQKAVTAPAASAPAPFQGAVTAVVETDPVPHSGDAADDIAVWIHPRDPSKSLIIGTDKLGGLATYDLAGKELAYYGGGRPNNVDVRHGFDAGGRRYDIVVASERETDTLLIFHVDPEARRLEDVRLNEVDTGFGIAGLCLYMDQAGRLYAFASDSSGTTKQFELFASGLKVSYRFIRDLELGFVTEGCVADDRTGYLYLSDESGRISRTPAHPDAPLELEFIANQEILTADVEGLAIAGDLLLASSQGSDDFVALDLTDGAYLGRFTIEAGTIDGVTHTDGIEVVVANLGPDFPDGVFIAQDDENDDGNQNFKLVSWRAIEQLLPVTNR